MTAVEGQGIEHDRRACSRDAPLQCQCRSDEVVSSFDARDQFARRSIDVQRHVAGRQCRCRSAGEVKDANLGYGLTGGKGFIWVSMPYIEIGRKENALWWWGDKQATVEYCKTNLHRICKEFGGDSESIFICGFSRGAIAASYIGLADEDAF